MFIELTEFLQCPEDHDDAFCIVLPDEMVGRTIMRGVIGCPACRREYPIRNGVAEFGRYPAAGSAPATAPADPDTVAALLGLTNPGGFVILLGSAATLAAALAERLGGVHFVGINAPDGTEVSPALTLLNHQRKIPLRSAVARGVVVPAEMAHAAWLGEGARVLLRGQRVVVAGEDVVVPGLEPVAAGRGLWVGQKN